MKEIKISTGLRDLDNNTREIWCEFVGMSKLKLLTKKWFYLIKIQQVKMAILCYTTK